MRVGWEPRRPVCSRWPRPPRAGTRARAGRGGREGRAAGVRPGRRGGLGRGAEGASPGPSSATITMKGKAFLPRVAVVPVGGTRRVPEPGPDLPQRVLGVRREPLRPRPLQEAEERVLGLPSTPALVRVYCNIHPQMSAFVLVRDNPFWATRRGGRRLRDPGRARGELGAQGLARARGRGVAGGHGAREDGRGRRARSPSTPRSASGRRTRTSSARTTRPARSTERGARAPWD